jgi:hypothetical protein
MSFRVGLENIRNRYQFFSKEKIIIKDGEKFTVQIPVLKSDLSDLLVRGTVA